MLCCDLVDEAIEEGDLVYIVRPLKNYTRLPRKIRWVQRVVIKNKLLMAVSDGKRSRWGFVILSDGQEWNRYDVVLSSSVEKLTARHPGQIAMADYLKPVKPDMFLSRRYLRNAEVPNPYQETT